MQKLAMTGLTLLLLGACASQPEDARGVGFGDYNQHLAQERAEREAALAGGQPQTVLPPARENRTDIAALAAGAIDEAEGGSPAPQPAGGHSSISDEQDFEAVAGRESIESDAERLQRMQEQRVEIAPTAVPDRPGQLARITHALGEAGVNIKDIEVLGIREAGGAVRVAKNRLAKIALDGKPCASIADLLSGMTVLTYSEDPVAAAKVAEDFAKDNKKFEILGGAMGSNALDRTGVEAVSKMPSRDELIATIAGMIGAPASNIAGAIGAPASNIASILSTIEDKAAA